MTQIARVRLWEDGQILLPAGEVVRWVVVLDEGRLRVAHVRPDGSEDLRDGVRPGRLLGIVSAVAGTRFPFQVTAIGACKGRLYDRGKLLALMEADGAVSLDMARYVAHRAAYLEAATLEQRQEPLFQRVCRALLRLRAQGLGRPAADGYAILASQYDLARMVGTSRQYANVHLKRLQEMGVIRIGYGYIVLLQRSDASQSAEDVLDSLCADIPPGAV